VKELKPFGRSLEESQIKISFIQFAGERLCITSVKQPFDTHFFLFAGNGRN